MTPRTEILSVHKLRRVARSRERAIQNALARDPEAAHVLHLGMSVTVVPLWAHGVRVRKAGRFQWVVEATDWHGR